MGILNEDLKREVGSYADTEWTGVIGGTERTLTSKPLTSHDMKLISRAHPNFAFNPSMEGMVDMLILKARLDDEKVFDKGDKPTLMRLNTNTIGEMFGALFGAQIETTEEDFEDRAKN